MVLELFFLKSRRRAAVEAAQEVVGAAQEVVELAQEVVELALAVEVAPAAAVEAAGIITGGLMAGGSTGAAAYDVAASRSGINVARMTNSLGPSSATTCG